MVYTELDEAALPPRQQFEAEHRLERHCGFKDCLCTHSEPCYKGWTDSVDGQSAVPCRICRAGLLDVLSNCNPLGRRSDADHAKIRDVSERSVIR